MVIGDLRVFLGVTLHLKRKSSYIVMTFVVEEGGRKGDRERSHEFNCSRALVSIKLMLIPLEPFPPINLSIFLDSIVHRHIKCLKRFCFFTICTEPNCPYHNLLIWRE